MDINQLRESLTKLFTVNLALTARERVLVVTDYPPDLIPLDDFWQARRLGIQQVALDVAAYGQSFGQVTFQRYPENGRHGIEPPLPIWEVAFGKELVAKLVALGLMPKILAKNLTPSEMEEVRTLATAAAADAVRVVIALAWYSTSHTLFRKLLTEICGTRYASMPEFEKEMLTGAMAVDYLEMATRTQKIAAAINTAEYVTITAPNGTNLQVVIGERQARCDTGILTKPGSFSNLPAGEVFLAPLEGKSEGRLVFDLAASKKLPGPLTVVFAAGQAVQIEGEGPYRQFLEDLFNANPSTRNLAELGIGTNKGAKNPLNVLEAEKIWGTIHIALGDNSGFGGVVAAPFHQDYVVYQPTLTLYPKQGSPRPILTAGEWQDF